MKLAGGAIAGGLIALLLAHPLLCSREQVFTYWTSVVLVGWLVVLTMQRSQWRQLIPPGAVVGSVALIGSGSLLALVLSPEPAWGSLAFLGSQLLFLWIGWWLGSDRGLAWLLGITVLAGGAAVGGYGLLQHLHLDPLPPGTLFVDRVVSVFENPNTLANFMAALLPLAMAAFLQVQASKAQVLFLSSVGLIYAGLLLAGSRGAWWAALAGVLVLAGGYLHQIRRRVTQVHWRWIGTLLLLLGTITFLLSRETVIQGPAGPVSMQERAFSSKNIIGSGVQQDPSINHRYHIWQVTWQMIQEHPLLGSGYGSYARRFLEVRQALQNQGEFPVEGWNTHFDALYAHNEYLQIWAESGLLGLVGFVGLMVVVVAGAVKAEWQTKSPDLVLWGAIGLIAVMLVDSLVNYPLRLPLNSTIFWLALGMLANNRSSTPPARLIPQIEGPSP
ncbi:MAG: O-antigen ligase family protein [Candidatus Latescibacteria bacterium]|nr:O-antigen ligase family protein [Candidatus Latescibacterota bacterium]